jgi:hypothetical protein
MSILTCPNAPGNPAQKQTRIPRTCTPSTGVVSH